MLRKISFGALAVLVALAAAGAALFARNQAPAVAAISTAEAARDDSPWIIKLHAQWCPVCMLTKSVWSQIEAAYASHARLVVFDFTNEATTAASRAEAERLGLAAVFDEAGFATGPVIVLDGRTKQIEAWINGSRDFGEYRVAIDAAVTGRR